MRKPRLLRYSLTCIGILFVFSQLQCGGEKAPTLSFGYQPFGSNLAFFVAAENKLFEKHGINISPVKIISANDAANALINGDIIGNATIPLNVLLNIEENQPGQMKIFMVKATSSDRWSDYLLVKNGSQIDSIADLAGSKVGGYPGSAQQTLLKLILGKFMDMDEVVAVEMPPSTQLAGLETGQIDALLTYDELAITALQTGIAEVLEEDPICKHVVDPMYGFPYVLSSNFVKQNPDLARKVRDAMYEAADFIEQNDAEARQIMAKWVGTKPEIAAKVNFWAQVKAEDIDRAALQRLADIFYEAGVTHKKINTRTLYLTESDLSE